MDFAFNMSLSTINIARQFEKDYGMDLSVSDVKLLLHNAAMVERIFSTFGKCPNLMKKTLISLYSTAFEPLHNFYKFSELLVAHL